MIGRENSMRLLPSAFVLAIFLVSGCGDKNPPANTANRAVPPPPVSQGVPIDAAALMQTGQLKYAVVCLGCHGQNGKGQPPFPVLAGKPAADLVAMLKNYRAGNTRGPQSATMMPFAKALTDAEIDALSIYLAAQ